MSLLGYRTIESPFLTFTCDVGVRGQTSWALETQFRFLDGSMERLQKIWLSPQVEGRQPASVVGNMNFCRIITNSQLNINYLGT